MATRLENIVIATSDQAELARFYSELLGWQLIESPEEIDVRAPESQGWLLDLVFEPVTEPKTGKNRLHLDLASSSAEDQAAIIQRAKDLGAWSVDIGQGDVPWEVMADPHGNEFCVLEPRDIYRDTGALAAIVVDAADPHTLAGFWTEAAGWPVGKDYGDAVGLAPPNGKGPWLEFVPNTTPKTGQNRLHLDIRPIPGETKAANVTRLTALGAHPIDIGQGDVPWEVMADPENNEFCVLNRA
ncbi:VOC family protein [Actinocrispum sp. NPDC049592]|uniref:VOC family protein n=1 Tax=Actinocrispum sp. NPDC049592 TaxID=3154835 RepID=UPI00342C62E0